MLMPASLATLLLEKTTAGLRERERPYEGVLPKPSAQHELAPSRPCAVILRVVALP
jgi:hypothetical protein